MNETLVSTEEKSGAWKRVTAIVGAGLLAGLIAAGTGGVASAQTVITEPAPTEVVSLAQTEGDTDEDLDEHDGFGDLSEADEAAFAAFDDCLQNEGLDFDSESEPDEAALEAAFEKCEPLLENLSEDAHGGIIGPDLSPEDEAVFERFDTCLEDSGLDFDSESEPDEAAFDAAFEKCDPILEELSEGASEMFGDLGDLTEADEAVLERYDTCLEDAGLDFESEADLDEAAFDAAFESCDPILEELSAEAQELFEDCP